MAESKRKKKLEKVEAVIDELPSTKVYCVRCGLAYSRKKGFFPVSHSPMYRGSGYVPICNVCLDKMFEEYCRELGPKEALHRICMKLDLYWSEDVYDLVERTAGTSSRIRSYIGRTNLVKYINKSYDDTLKELGSYIPPSYSNTSIEQQKGEDDPHVTISPEVYDFWGSDFNPEFIQKLDRRYKKWTSDLGDLDKGAIALYKQICILEETINRDTAEGKPVDKSVNMLNTLLGSANLRPSQKKEDQAGASNDNSPMGVWIRRFENERPIPEPDPALRDVDKIVHYIQVFFLGHLAKMLGKSNIYSKMYEDEIARLRVERPDVSLEHEDDEAFFEAAFGDIPEDGDIN